jgi:hypothetical protein
MCKYLVIILMIAITTSTQADYIFELASEYEVEGESWQAVCLDAGYFNDDAYPDFAVAYFYGIGEDAYLYTFLGNGDCTFSVMPTETFDYPLGSITVNDFDNDGYDDLLIGEGYAYGGGGLSHELLIHMYKGNGDGSFTELDTLHVMNVWVTSGDLNDDGNNDLVVSGFENGNSTVSIKLGNGDFTFHDTESYEVLASFFQTVQILGDMNLDGYVDIGVLCLDGRIQFLYGNGDGTFQPPVKVVNYFPCGPSYCFLDSGDFDEDGIPDFVATCGDILADYDVVFLWDDGSFSHDADSLLFLNTTYNTYGLISEDFDLDGDFDLIISEHSYSLPDYIRCYRNTTISLGVEEESSCSISDLKLEVSPNPFSSSVTVSALGFSSNSSDLQIFDLSGRLVSEIEPVFNGSEAVYQWDGRSETGLELPDGIYSARLSSEESNTGIMLLKLE